MRFKEGHAVTIMHNAQARSELIRSANAGDLFCYLVYLLAPVCFCSPSASLSVGCCPAHAWPDVLGSPASVASQPKSAAPKPSKESGESGKRDKTATARPDASKKESKRETSSVCCSTCGSSFKTADQLQQHMNDTGHGADQWSCKRCDKAFKSEQGLQQHVADTGHAQLGCGVCGKVFESDTSLLQHARSTGHGESAQTASSKTAKSASSSSSSSDRVGAGAGAGAGTGAAGARGAGGGAAAAFFCRECGREFATQAAVNQHVQSTGHDSSPWTCADCDKSFDDGARLQQHSASTGHWNSLFACSACGVVTRTSSVLTACPGSPVGHFLEMLDLRAAKFV